MPRGSHAERVKKTRQDVGESSRSRPVTVSGRELRSKRRADPDVIEEVDPDHTTSGDDSEENPAYVFTGAPGDGDDDEEMGDAGEGDEDDGSSDQSGSRDEQEQPAFDASTVRKPFYPYGRNPVNYIGDRMAESVRKLRDVDPYTGPKFNGDPRFWTQFHQDFYTSVIIRKEKITHEAQYVDWGYMRKKKNPIFDQVIAECKAKGIAHLMGFKHGWNKELIA